MAKLSFVNQAEGMSRPFEIIERYITNIDKAKSGYIGRGCIVNKDIAGCMNIVAMMCGETGDAKLVHFTITFSPTEVSDLKIASGIAEQIKDFIGTKYQVCYSIHENTEYLHIHFVFQSLCYLDGRRYGGEADDQYLTNFIARILRYRAGISLNIE